MGVMGEDAVQALFEAEHVFHRALDIARGAAGAAGDDGEAALREVEGEGGNSEEGHARRTTLLHVYKRRDETAGALKAHFRHGLSS